MNVQYVFRIIIVYDSYGSGGTGEEGGKRREVSLD